MKMNGRKSNVMAEVREFQMKEHNIETKICELFF